MVKPTCPKYWPVSQKPEKSAGIAVKICGVPVNDGALMLAPRGLADRWRDRPVGEISTADIHAIIDESREKAVPGLERKSDGPSEAMARVMHTTLSRLYQAAGMVPEAEAEGGKARILDWKRQLKEGS